VLKIKKNSPSSTTHHEPPSKRKNKTKTTLFEALTAVQIQEFID
jgi:hypothetical protein